MAVALLPSPSIHLHAPTVLSPIMPSAVQKPCMFQHMLQRRFDSKRHGVPARSHQITKPLTRVRHDLAPRLRANPWTAYQYGPQVRKPHGVARRQRLGVGHYRQCRLVPEARHAEARRYGGALLPAGHWPLALGVRVASAAPRDQSRRVAPMSSQRHGCALPVDRASSVEFRWRA